MTININKQKSILFDRLPDQCQTLLVGLSEGTALVRPQLVRAEAWYPHVPVALEVQLHVFDLHLWRFSVLGQHAGRVHGIFDEIVCNLQQNLLDIFV